MTNHTEYIVVSTARRPVPTGTCTNPKNHARGDRPAPASRCFTQMSVDPLDRGFHLAGRATRAIATGDHAVRGPGHPDTAGDRGQLAVIVSEVGRHNEAELELRRTAENFAAALGPEHVEVASARTALYRMGRLYEADAYHEGLAMRVRS